MTELTITAEKLVSASVSIKSSGWTDYEIKSDVQINDKKVNSFQSGEVIRLSDKIVVATFYTMYNGNDNNLSVNYMVDNSSTQCEINQKINEFMIKAKADPITMSNLGA